MLMTMYKHFALNFGEVIKSQDMFVGNTMHVL